MRVGKRFFILSLTVLATSIMSKNSRIKRQEPAEVTELEVDPVSTETPLTADQQALCDSYCQAASQSPAAAGNDTEVQVDGSSTEAPVVEARSADSDDSLGDVTESSDDGSNTNVDLTALEQQLTDAGLTIEQCSCPVSNTVTDSLGNLNGTDTNNSDSSTSDDNSDNPKNHGEIERYGGFITLAMIPYFLH